MAGYKATPDNALLFAEWCVEHTGYTITDLQHEFKLNPATVKKILAMPEFKQKYTELLHDKFAGLRDLAIGKLKEKITEGNIKAILYALDNSGFKEPDQLEVTTDTVVIDIK